MARARMVREYTWVQQNRAKSVSKLTTIPDWVAHFMGLEKGDRLKWEYDHAHRQATFYKSPERKKTQEPVDPK